MRKNKQKKPKTYKQSDMILRNGDIPQDKREESPRRYLQSDLIFDTNYNLNEAIKKGRSALNEGFKKRITGDLVQYLDEEEKNRIRESLINSGDKEYKKSFLKDINEKVERAVDDRIATNSNIIAEEVIRKLKKEVVISTDLKFKKYDKKRKILYLNEYSIDFSKVRQQERVLRALATKPKREWDWLQVEEFHKTDDAQNRSDAFRLTCGRINNTIEDSLNMRNIEFILYIEGKAKINPDYIE